MREWRYSRKSPDWHAMPKLAMRYDRPTVVKRGRLVRDQPNSWLVKFEGEAGAMNVSKKYATVDGDTWTIPGWLWARMTGT